MNSEQKLKLLKDIQEMRYFFKIQKRKIVDRSANLIEIVSNESKKLTIKISLLEADCINQIYRRIYFNKSINKNTYEKICRFQAFDYIEKSEMDTVNKTMYRYVAGWLLVS